MPATAGSPSREMLIYFSKQTTGHDSAQFSTLTQHTCSSCFLITPIGSGSRAGAREGEVIPQGRPSNEDASHPTYGVAEEMGRHCGAIRREEADAVGRGDGFHPGNAPQGPLDTLYIRRLDYNLLPTRLPEEGGGRVAADR